LLTSASEAARGIGNDDWEMVIGNAVQVTRLICDTNNIVYKQIKQKDNEKNSYKLPSHIKY